MNNQRHLACWVVGLLTLNFTVGRLRAELPQATPAELTQLRAEVAALRSSVKAKQEKIKSLTQRSTKLEEMAARLEALCRKHGVEYRTPAETEAAKKGGAEKFKALYETHHDKIAFVGGKYYDVGKDLYDTPEVSKEAPGPGAYRITPADCKVVQVVKRSEAIIVRPAFESRSTGTGLHSRLQAAAFSRPELTFHVKGLDTKSLIDASPFSGKLVYAGTYRYGTRTIQSYTVYSSLTREQFRDVLAKGFKLVDYRLVPVTPKRKAGWNRGLVSRRDPKTKKITWYKVEATPVEPKAIRMALEGYGASSTKSKTLKTTKSPLKEQTPVTAEKGVAMPVKPTARKRVPLDATAWSRHHYKVFDETVPVTVARKRCEELGGHLVRIESRAENEFVVELIHRSGKIRPRSYWLDGSDEAEEKVWRFTNGQKMTYTAWAPKRPCNEPERHWIRYHDGHRGWDDIGGGNRKTGFVCEWDY